MSKRKASDYEEGSGNVFADLRLKNADELFARAKIGLEVLKILQNRDLPQREIGTLLNIRQSEVSHLMRGHFHHFSEGKLLGFLKRLDREVKLVIRQPNQKQGVSLSL